MPTDPRSSPAPPSLDDATAKTVVLASTAAISDPVAAAARPPPVISATAHQLDPTASAGRPARLRRLLAHALAAAGLLGLLVTSLAPAFLGHGEQHQAVFEAMVQSQRLPRAVSQALVGNATAFPELRESVELLARNLRSLRTGEGSLPALPGALQGLLEPIMPLVERAEKNAAVVLTQQQTLTRMGPTRRAVTRHSAELLETAETVASLKLQQGASAPELFAVGQLVMLTQRIGKSANEFFTTDGVSADAVSQLGQDLSSFKAIAEGVVSGSAELRLPGTREPRVRELLQQLLAQYEQLRSDAGVLLANVPGLVAAAEAQGAVVKDSEPLRRGLAELAGRLRADAVGPWWPLAFGVVLLFGYLALAFPLPGPGVERKKERQRS